MDFLTDYLTNFNFADLENTITEYFDIATDLLASLSNIQIAIIVILFVIILFFIRCKLNSYGHLYRLFEKNDINATIKLCKKLEKDGNLSDAAIIAKELFKFKNDNNIHSRIKNKIRWDDYSILIAKQYFNKCKYNDAEIWYKRAESLGKTSATEEFLRKCLGEIRAKIEANKFEDIDILISKIQENSDCFNSNEIEIENLFVFCKNTITTALNKIESEINKANFEDYIFKNNDDYAYVYCLKIISLIEQDKNIIDNIASKIKIFCNNIYSCEKLSNLELLLNRSINIKNFTNLLKNVYGISEFGNLAVKIADKYMSVNDYDNTEIWYKQAQKLGNNDNVTDYTVIYLKKIIDEIKLQHLDKIKILFDRIQSNSSNLNIYEKELSDLYEFCKNKITETLDNIVDEINKDTFENYIFTTNHDYIFIYCLKIIVLIKQDNISVDNINEKLDKILNTNNLNNLGILLSRFIKIQDFNKLLENFYNIFNFGDASVRVAKKNIEKREYEIAERFYEYATIFNSNNHLMKGYLIACLSNIITEIEDKNITNINTVVNKIEKYFYKFNIGINENINKLFIFCKDKILSVASEIDGYLNPYSKLHYKSYKIQEEYLDVIFLKCFQILNIISKDKEEFRQIKLEILHRYTPMDKEIPENLVKIFKEIKNTK